LWEFAEQDLRAGVDLRVAEQGGRAVRFTYSPGQAHRDLTMHVAWFNQMEILMTEYGLKHVAASVKCVRFEREGLSVETCNRGETFEIRHGGTVHISPGLADLAQYLENLPAS